MKLASKVWVVIAAYNEQKHIGAVIDAAKKVHSNIVVVDDGSRDKTFDIAKQKGADALRHVVNLGKGNALKTGCEYALLQGAEEIVVLDADGQHKPEQIPEFLKELKGKGVVFGYRKFSSKMPLVFRFGNSLLNHTTKLLFGIDIKDTQCGYRAFTASAYKKIKWDSNDYRMESEMIVNVAKHNVRYTELGIETIYADKYKGTTFIDGIKITLNLIWWKLTKA